MIQNKLETFYNDTQKKLEETKQKVVEYKEQAEGYIAISQYREEKKKEEDIQKYGFPSVKDDTNKFESSKFTPEIGKIQEVKKSSTKENVDIDQNLKVTAEETVDLNQDVKVKHQISTEKDFENDIECKSVENHCEDLNILNNEGEENSEKSKNEDRSQRGLSANEKRINNLKVLIEKGTKDINNLSNLLEKLKEKQKNVQKEEEKQKPTLTNEMIRQIKLSFNYCKEDRERIENLENSNKTNFQEIMVKLGNKIDSIEVEGEMEKLKERIAECWQKMGSMQAHRRNTKASIYPPDLMSESTGDKANRKLIERTLEEFGKRIETFEGKANDLTKCFSKQSEELKGISIKISNLNISEIYSSLSHLEEKMNAIELKIHSGKGPKIGPQNEKLPILNYTVTSPKEKEAILRKPNKIIINNNADKLETEKSLRDLNRKIQDLRKETFRKFDFTESEFHKFKKSCGSILERQDQSILSILTRTTALEIRSDCLEADGIKAMTIDTGLGKTKGRRDKQQLLEALLIAEKLVEDFKGMRKEVFSKLYEIQEKDLKSKANS